MNSFLQHCRDLVTEDVIRRLLAPLKCALLMFTQYEQHIVVLYGNFFQTSLIASEFRKLYHW